MKSIKILILIILKTNLCVSQKFLTKNIILDFETLKPISNVHIYNQFDNTISNNDGIFNFISNDSLVILSHVGYDEIKSNFTFLNKNDTIFFKSKVISLDEIVITDKKNVIRKVYENVNENYPFSSFNDELFLRCVLRKNGEIVKIQDMVVNIQRNSLFTNEVLRELEFNVEVLNIRKAGITPKSKKEEQFKFLSFEELFRWFSSIFTVPTIYNYKEDKLLDNRYSKVNFNKNSSNKDQKSLEGFYILNLDDYSFNKVFYKTVFENISTIPYKTDKNVKWRTIGNELFVDYKKNISLNKYFLNSGKLKNVVEVINNGVENIYEASYEILVVKNNTNIKFNSNFSSKKDLFKADFNYQKSFWEKQNQLLLDEELIYFIKNLNKLKDKYHVETNFDF